LIDDLFNLKLDGLVINGQPLKIIAPQTNEEKLIELKRLSDAGPPMATQSAPLMATQTAPP